MILSMVPAVSGVTVEAMTVTGNYAHIPDSRARDGADNFESNLNPRLRRGPGVANSTRGSERGGAGWILGTPELAASYWRGHPLPLGGGGIGPGDTQLMGRSTPRNLNFAHHIYAVPGAYNVHVARFDVSGLGTGNRRGYGNLLPDLANVVPGATGVTQSSIQHVATLLDDLFITGHPSTAFLPAPVMAMTDDQFDAWGSMGIYTTRAAIAPQARTAASPLIGYDDVVPFELLAFHTQNLSGVPGADPGAQYTLFILREGSNRNRGIIVVYANLLGVSAAQMTAFGISNASAPLSLVSYAGANIDLTIHPGGFGQIPHGQHRLGTREDYRFTFGIDGTVRPFHHRTALRPIDIREVHAGTLTNSVYQVEMTLERGFVFDRRHENSFTSSVEPLDRDDGGVRVNSVLGAVTGFGPMHSALGVTGNGQAISAAYRGTRTELEDVQRDRNRRLITAPFVGAGVASGWADTIRIGQNDSLWIQADGGREGDVRVYVELFRVTGINSASVSSYYAGGGTNVRRERRIRDENRTLVASGWVVPARLTSDEIIFERYENHDLEDFLLVSGMREWSARQMQAGATVTAGHLLPLWDAVEEHSPAEYYHKTATVVLTETVHGVLPFTGLRDINFEFPRGVQVLGVRWETNDAHFAPTAANNTYGYEWYYDGRTRRGPLDILIQRNLVSMRPELGRVETRYRVAEIRAHFYISIQAGHYALFGDTIEVRAVGPGFEDGRYADVALVQDPITVRTVPVTVDGGDDAAFGRMRHERLNDIVIYENYPGALRHGTQLWLGVEGGVSLAWGTADLVSINAGTVTADADSGLRIGLPTRDQRGVFVNIERRSNNDPGYIRFSNVEISGALVAGHTYDIIVAGSAVADNFGVSGFEWTGPLFGGGTFTRIGHGLFTDEPYPTIAFSFVGDDIFAPPGTGPVVQPPVTPPVTPGLGPVTFWQHSSHHLVDGGNRAAPVFMLLPNPQNPAFHTSYVDARVVADVLGFPWGPGASGWDAATNTVTFTDGVNTVSFTTNQNSAIVNGVSTPMTSGGYPLDARVINDRMFVPVVFFNYLPFAGRVQWNSYATPADRSITIFPN
jgi:hypothetical protein